MEILNHDESVKSSAHDELKGSLKHVIDQQNTIIHMLINIDGSLIRFIDEPTEDLMLLAVKQDGMAIQYILPAKQTSEIKMAAIKSNPFCMEYVYDPTIQMWVEAVKTEYPDDDTLQEKHPVHLVKNAQLDACDKTLAYITFLEENPEYYAIIDDIRGHSKEADIWYHILTHDGDAMDCPDEILGEIIDRVMEHDPRILVDCNPKYWNFDRIEAMFSETIVFFPTVLEQWEVINNWDVRDLFKLAFNSSKNSVDVQHIKYNMSSIHCTFDMFLSIMECDDPFRLMRLGVLDRFGMNKKISEYILDKFKLEDLYRELPYFMIENIIAELPLIQRLQYKHKLKQYKLQHQDAEIGDE